MEEVLKYVLLVFAGAVAGMINIIAGAGSLITLPILIGFGLPPTIANGTNRIAVIFQDISATYNFLKTKKLPVRIGLKLLLPTVIGGVPGAILASGLTDSILNIIIVSILILMLVYMVWQPQKLTVTSNSSPKDNVGLFTFMLFLVIGFYAGFIQAGATYIWFAALLWRIKVDMVVADALKIFLNLVLTPFVLVVFFYCHQVSLLDGLFLGLGSFFGGWYGSKAAIHWNPKLIRIVMISILITTLLYMLLFKILKVF